MSDVFAAPRSELIPVFDALSAVVSGDALADTTLDLGRLLRSVDKSFFEVVSSDAARDVVPDTMLVLCVPVDDSETS